MDTFVMEMTGRGKFDFLKGLRSCTFRTPEFQFELKDLTRKEETKCCLIPIFLYLYFTMTLGGYCRLHRLGSGFG